MRHLTTACLLLLAAAPAWTASAEDRPAMFPTRDVTVTYQGMNGRDVTIEFGAAARRMRISGMGAQGGYAIIERDGKEMFIVMPEKQMAMRLPESPRMQDALSMHQLSGFKPAGAATVAGVSCRLWDVHGPRGDGEICITGDGVMLRARRLGAAGPNDRELQAIKVDYHGLPAGDFEVPSGYQTMTVPQGMPPGGMPQGSMPQGGMSPGAKPQP